MQKPQGVINSLLLPIKTLGVKRNRKKKKDEKKKTEEKKKTSIFIMDSTYLIKLSLSHHPFLCFSQEL